MTDTAVESRSWPPLKWVVTIAAIFAFQAGFFYWFARTPSRRPSAIATMLTVHLPAGASGEIPGSISPLILIRPGPQNFSGSAWLHLPPLNYTPARSNLPPVYLPPQPNRLGSSLAQALSNNLPQNYVLALGSPPGFAGFDFAPPVEDPPSPSSLAVQGGLADRTLLNPPVLKTQSADAALRDTVVLVQVDARGRVCAPPVLDPFPPVLAPVLAGAAITTESPDANTYALSIAAGLLWQPLPRRPGTGPSTAAALTPGRLVFHWQTVPAPATNDPAAPR